jgi:hypothetical protein
VESPVSGKWVIQEWEDEYRRMQEEDERRKREEVENWREQVLLATYLDFTHVGT